MFTSKGFKVVLLLVVLAVCLQQTDAGFRKQFKKTGRSIKNRVSFVFKPVVKQIKLVFSPIRKLFHSLKPWCKEDKKPVESPISVPIDPPPKNYRIKERLLQKRINSLHPKFSMDKLGNRTFHLPENSQGTDEVPSQLPTLELPTNSSESVPTNPIELPKTDPIETPQVTTTIPPLGETTLSTIDENTDSSNDESIDSSVDEVEEDETNDVTNLLLVKPEVSEEGSD